MISLSLDINEGDLDYRDIIGFYFAKWFDEPFTVDVLNRTHFLNFSYSLAPQSLDRKHKDYMFTGKDNKTHYVDAKTHIHNFHIRSKQKNMPPKTADVITVGQYARNTSGTEFLSFVYRSRIYFIYHPNLHSITPIFEHVSSGQNNKYQQLFHYDVNDLINAPGTYYTDIPQQMNECYEAAYALFTQYRNEVTEHSLTLKKNAPSDLTFNLSVATKLKDGLVPIIQRFNLIYDELPKENEKELLSEIYSILN